MLFSMLGLRELGGDMNGLVASSKGIFCALTTPDTAA